MSLTVRGIEFGRGAQSVLSGVGLTAEPGEVVGVLGPNGVGKTTLLKCILRILRPRSGSVSVDGQDMASLTPRQRAKRLAYVPQGAPARFPLSVFEFALMGRRPHLRWRPSAKDAEVVAETLARLGLEDLAGRDFESLSGGQKQKVLLARAFAQQARYLLLDEPTSNLDVNHQLEIMGLLRRAVAADDMGAVIAIHDLNLAARFADRVVLLFQGAVFSDGEPAEVLSEENVRAVFGVQVKVFGYNGQRHLIPVQTVGR
ncbi:MAG: ABC transporter ATP-binding protein [Desulfovibrionaceae bacterium]|nr:ABC transporter ATP-binding protein [Desulfovibrionaceae bacterium]MDD4951989.1 ABC transporter ATP-binding protein [Desulfovibrionaceae bacterium]